MIYNYIKLKGINGFKAKATNKTTKPPLNHRGIVVGFNKHFVMKKHQQLKGGLLVWTLIL